MKIVKVFEPLPAVRDPEVLLDAWLLRMDALMVSDKRERLTFALDVLESLMPHMENPSVDEILRHIRPLLQEAWDNNGELLLRRRAQLLGIVGEHTTMSSEEIERELARAVRDADWPTSDT